MDCHVRSDKDKGERAEGQESLHTMSGPIGYLSSATNLHVKLSSATEQTHTHTQMNSPLFTRIVMMTKMMMTIILMMMIIINNNFHNLNEAFT